jgi:hypothetical protein
LLDLNNFLNSGGAMSDIQSGRIAMSLTYLLDALRSLPDGAPVSTAGVAPGDNRGWSAPGPTPAPEASALGLPRRISKPIAKEARPALTALAS